MSDEESPLDNKEVNFQIPLMLEDLRRDWKCKDLAEVIGIMIPYIHRLNERVRDERGYIAFMNPEKEEYTLLEPSGFEEIYGNRESANGDS